MLPAVFLLIGLAGCATVTDISVDDGLLSRPRGVYHKVLKGQTLWRIAKTYQVGLDEIILSNSIPDAALIEENQLIFIPGADDVRDVVVEPMGETAHEFIWPAKGRILRYYGDRIGRHRSRGIRIETHPGQPVKASRQGTVIFADYLTGYAYTVILDHGEAMCSVYGRNAELVVALGDEVAQGQILAKAGENGEGSFLHFEIRRDARADNPLYYLPPL